MKDLLCNLILGIIGGVFSGVIVSRTFLIRDDIEEQLNLLHDAIQQLGSMRTCFSIIESILKLSHDTSDEIKHEIEKDPSFIKTHDLIYVDDVVMTIKKTMLDTAVENFCIKNSFTILSDNQFLELQKEAKNTVIKYKNIKDFKFKTIEDCEKEIENLEERYNACLKSRSRFFISLIFHDKILVGLCVFFILLCCLLLVVK